MDYALHRVERVERNGHEMRQRIVPPRTPQNLRKGGGRKNSVGWTEQKRRTNRRRFDQLRPFIRTAVTIIYPAQATSAQLAALNTCNRNFCKEKAIPARSVWEGPGYHQHIALGVPQSSNLEKLWMARLRKRWLDVFGIEITPKAFLWKPDVEPDKIASYLSKTRKDGGLRVKTASPWLTFAPCWEVGFRALAKATSHPQPRPATPRKKRVISTPASCLSHPISPRYTAKDGQTPEKEREICPICWRRWGKSLWAGSCKCIPGFPYMDTEARTSPLPLSLAVLSSQDRIAR